MLDKQVPSDRETWSERRRYDGVMVILQFNSGKTTDASEPPVPGALSPWDVMRPPASEP